MSQYVVAAEEEIARLEGLGRQIDFVYVSGDNINARFDYAAYNRDNRKKYKYVTPQFIDTGPGEVEYAMRKDNSLKETLMAEYMLDLAMYTTADAFVGVHSNVWALVYSSRLTKSGSQRSCMFDTHTTAYDYSCDTCDPKFWYPANELSCGR